MKTIYALRQDVVEIATNVAEPNRMTRVGKWQTMFGQAVRKRRQALELTLEEASAAIGISRSHLNLIELGKQLASPATLPRGSTSASALMGYCLRCSQRATPETLQPTPQRVRRCGEPTSTRPCWQWRPGCSWTLSGWWPRSELIPRSWVTWNR
jgi:hypothetical protein